VNRRNPHPLKNCLDNFKKSCGDLDKLSKINENWKNLIGLELFQECKPLNIEKKILTALLLLLNITSCSLFFERKNSLTDKSNNNINLEIVKNYSEAISREPNNFFYKFLIENFHTLNFDYKNIFAFFYIFF